MSYSIVFEPRDFLRSSGEEGMTVMFDSQRKNEDIEKGESVEYPLSKSTFEREQMIKPQKLKEGDTIAAVTPSWGGPGTAPYRYQVGKRQFEEAFGVSVIEMPNTCASAEFLAQNPQARAEDLMQAFTDPSVSGIVCTIGGDDSIRLLPYLDLKIIAENPKPFIGYSDATVIHFACFKAGLISFYGPTFMSGFAENCGMHEYLTNSFQQMLFSSAAPGEILPNSSGWTAEMLDWGDPLNQDRPRKLQPSSGWRYLQGEGVAQGHLIGGCVEVMNWLRGTPVWPELDQWSDAILFWETSEEAPPPEVLVRELRSYAAMGILERLSGVLFARPGGPVSPANHELYDQALLEVLREELGMKDLSIVSGMDFGHTDPFLTLPYGARAEIDCKNEKISILESGVSDGAKIERGV